MFFRVNDPAIRPRKMKKKNGASAPHNFKFLLEKIKAGQNYNAVRRNKHAKKQSDEEECEQMAS